MHILQAQSGFHSFMDYLKWYEVAILSVFKDERSIWLELNILLIFFPKNSKIRVWARLTSNFNTQKSNFVRNCMELLFITNMLSSPSYARPYLTFEYFYHKLLHVIFIVIIYQSQRFYVKYFILLNWRLCSSLLRVCIIN